MIEPKKNLSGESLGINGIGRIGKLTLWHHLGRKAFGRIVVNLGRKTGTSLADLAHYIERDSTYGTLHTFLYGHRAEPVIDEIRESDGIIVINGIPVQFLFEARNPADIDWSGHGVRLVVDTTGQFKDPTLPGDVKGGSCTGHLDAGAEKVIVSAPFKIKDKRSPMPDYAVTTVMGINQRDYDPSKHRIISNASCTTTCLAHMVKPLLDNFGPQRLLTASMATIHAATGTQAVLDRLPSAGASDLRKTRGIMDNIILTSTGAAATLGLVIPEMNRIGFMAESVRVPTAAGSLVILVVNLQDDDTGEEIRRDLINGIYKQCAENDSNKYLQYSERQNVSTDIQGHPMAAAVIEGHETHTRTASISLDLGKMLASRPGALEQLGEDTRIDVPVTQAVIYGWYDNEFGCYVNMLGERVVSIAETL